MIKIQIGGSPCTFWSIARAATNSPITRETANEGMGWELYLNYLIALDKFQPDIWLYENVASMSKEIKASISAHFGSEPHQINGGLVSAAERDRFYWTNNRKHIVAKQIRKSKQERLDLVNSLKTPCQKCGESRPYLIQFHHRNPDEKLFEIPQVNSHGVEAVKREVKKCVCLCANCHMEFHWMYGKRPDNPEKALELYLNTSGDCRGVKP